MTGPWSRTALIAVIGVVGASLAVAVVLTVLGDDLGDRRSAGVDGYSVSAIGHRGLVELLGRLGVPVVVSRSDSAARARHGLLIVAEPAVSDPASRARLAALVDAAPRALVVLPKWYGSVERGKRWIEDASLLPVDDVTAVLEALDLADTGVHRAVAPGAGLGSGNLRPVIREPQLIAGTALTAIIAGPRGDWLLGRRELDRGELDVLSDPDVLNNFGLRHPENARFAVQLIDDLRDGGPVVIDETLHGYARSPSLVHALLGFPLVLATLQVLVCAVLVVWAAMVRFGPRRAAPPPIAPGKDFLIRNTAALLHHGGHHAHALRRYLALSVAAVRHALHAPALPPVAITAWLERVRAVRGGRISLTGLERDVETAHTPARVVEVADAVYRWRMDMTHGSDEHS
ncbi:MAG TPA: DUF4350 domain-containing protein [Kofleriaceae bacterium]|nr:DUF4350 domain-containing protein [Kofleriaceae bacterium]